MAYTAPTQADFLARFPRFTTASTALIDALLVEATRQVDDSWLEEDYATAILYLTAHMLVQEGSTGTSDRPGTIASESFGPMSISYSAGSAVSNLDATEYGRRFRELRRRNFPGVAIASTG